jgi:hypothetical protein
LALQRRYALAFTVTDSVTPALTDVETMVVAVSVDAIPPAAADNPVITDGK